MNKQQAKEIIIKNIQPLFDFTKPGGHWHDDEAHDFSWVVDIDDNNMVETHRLQSVGNIPAGFTLLLTRPSDGLLHEGEIYVKADYFGLENELITYHQGIYSIKDNPEYWAKKFVSEAQAEASQFNG